MVIGIAKASNNGLGFYDNTAIVDMADYEFNYRTLNCWECYQAKGKMCHYRDYSSMIAITGSSNNFHGICCKPDFNGENCHSDEKMECSQSVIDKSEEYKDIVSGEYINNQIFAFCPGVN